MEGGQRDEPRIDSEEIAQRGAPLAAAETIGSERGKPTRLTDAEGVGALTG